MGTEKGVVGTPGWNVPLSNNSSEPGNDTPAGWWLGAHASQPGSCAAVTSGLKATARREVRMDERRMAVDDALCVAIVSKDVAAATSRKFGRLAFGRPGRRVRTTGVKACRDASILWRHTHRRG